MTAEGALTQGDIDRLLADGSAAAQMEVARKLTAHYAAEGEGALTAGESGIADDIFRQLLARAEVQVRAVLAKNLSQTQKLPAELARRMANDVSEVACPVLEHSNALSDDELIGLISDDAEKLRAIARRETVSEPLSDALVETRIESVVGTLVQNEGASISERTFEKIVERHGDSAEVVEPLLQRGAIPLAVVDQVIDRLSETMRQDLELKYGNLAELKEMRQALEKSLELTSLKMLGFTSSDEELMRVLKHLDGSNKLSPFAALSTANLQLFEVSLSRLLRVPLRNVHMLVVDPEGFRQAYSQAELPESLFEAAAMAVRAIRDLEQESLASLGYRRLPTPMEVMERMEELMVEQEVAGSEYLYALMKRNLNLCRVAIQADPPGQAGE
jgi:uncharacterized protein (DUF2336 family)